MQTTTTWRTRPMHSSAAGFSLIETLVVLTLLGILLGLAVPGMASWRHRHELQSVAEDVWNGLVLARSQALVHQQRVVLCPLSAQGVCDVQGQWQQGWQLFVDSNRNGQRDGQEPILLTRGALPAGTRLQGNSTVSRGVGYGAEGRSEGVSGGFQAGTFTLCRSGLSEGWRVVVNALGRPRLESAAAVECP